MASSSDGTTYPRLVDIAIGDKEAGRPDDRSVADAVVSSAVSPSRK
jgi:hypothetical protein